jgi:AcrR family transcriptional regulator
MSTSRQTQTPAGASEAPAPRRGRPRSPEADQAIVAATLRLLPRHGLAGLTIEAIAAEAGVGKTTIYRRWASKEELLASVIAGVPPPSPPPGTGSLQGDLEALRALQMERLADSPLPRILPRLLAESADDPELHRLFVERTIEPLRDILRTTIRRAIERGEVRDDVNVEGLIDILHGVPVYRILLSGGDMAAVEPIPGLFMSILLDGLRPSSSSEGRASAPPRSSGSSRGRRARSG